MASPNDLLTDAMQHGLRYAYETGVLRADIMRVLARVNELLESGEADGDSALRLLGEISLGLDSTLRTAETRARWMQRDPAHRDPAIENRDPGPAPVVPAAQAVSCSTPQGSGSRLNIFEDWMED